MRVSWAVSKVGSCRHGPVRDPDGLVALSGVTTELTKRSLLLDDQPISGGTFDSRETGASVSVVFETLYLLLSERVFTAERTYFHVLQPIP